MLKKKIASSIPIEIPNDIIKHTLAICWNYYCALRIDLKNTNYQRAYQNINSDKEKKKTDKCHSSTSRS